MANKKDKVKAEIKRLNEVFNGIDENKKKFVHKQIEQLAWLNVSIEELQKAIDDEGNSVTYDNGGGQVGSKCNPNSSMLVAYQKNALAIIKQLNDLVPNSTKKSKLSDLLDE